MVTAAPQDQWRLLDLQAHDTRLTQLAHRRRTLPEHAEVERLGARQMGLESTLVGARTALADTARELKKAEGDVDQVRQRETRNQARLDAGAGSAKDMQALSAELGTLAARRSTLEDVQLEVMERLEAAEARAAALQTQVDAAAADLAAAVAGRDAALAEIDAERALVDRARAETASGVPPQLLALYEKVREQCQGVGAARLHQRRCEGCRLELTPSDIGRIRAEPADAVVRCEECRRILVRTADSGL